MIRPIFCNFIDETYLKLDNKEIIQQCEKLVKETPDSPNQAITNFKIVELAKLQDRVQTRCVHLLNELGIQNQGVYIYESWVNSGKAETFGGAHIHPGFLLAAVYYPHESDSHLEFVTPFPEHRYALDPNLVIEHNEYTSSSCRVYPEEGKLIIFPAWLTHFVVSNDDRQRVSIAFNINPIP